MGKLSRFTGVIFAVGAIAGVLSLAPKSSAYDNAGFLSPSGNIACAAYDGVLRCDLKENQARVPARPRTCEGDFGNYFSMSAKGKPERICVGDTVFGEYRVLGYGKSWSAQGFTCVSEQKGLTCRNSAKKGWFLNKVEQKFF